MKKLILLLLLTVFVGSNANAKVTFKDWMTKGLISNVKQLKQDRKNRNSDNTNNKNVSSETELESESDSYSGEYDTTDDNTKRIEMIDISDPEFEWDQFVTKNTHALMTERGLHLKNKKNGLLSISTVKLPFDIDNDEFTYSIKVDLTGKKSTTTAH